MSLDTIIYFDYDLCRCREDRNGNQSHDDPDVIERREALLESDDAAKDRNGQDSDRVDTRQDGAVPASLRKLPHSEKIERETTYADQPHDHTAYDIAFFQKAFHTHLSGKHGGDERNDSEQESHDKDDEHHIRHIGSIGAAVDPSEAQHQKVVDARTDKDEQRKKIVDLFPLHPFGNALSLADRDHNQCDNRSYNSQNLDARHGFIEQHDRQGHGDQQREFARNAGHTDAQFFRHIAVQVEINEGNAA